MTYALLLGAALGVAGAAESVQGWDLEQDDGGLSGDMGGLQWEWGTVDASAGPGGGFTGANAWATRVDRLYLNDAEDHLSLPARDLGDVAQPVLSWWQWIALGGGDVAWIEVWDGESWSSRSPAYGYPDEAGFVDTGGAWQQVFVSLEGLTDLSDLRLSFSADAGGSDYGWYVDDFALWDGDVVPPAITALDALDDTQDISGPYEVSAVADDDGGPPSLSLIYSADDGEVRVEMIDYGDGLFVGEIPGQPPDSEVTYRVEATDGANLATAPTEGEYGFRVYLPAPTDLTGPDGRVAGTAVALSWSPPETPHDIAGYGVYQDGALAAEVYEPEASIPIDTTGQRDFRAVARFEIEGASWEGDPSEALTLDLAASAISGLDPAEAFQGDTVRVRLSGQNLLLVEGALEIDLGGVEATEIDVIDVDRADLVLTVGADAAVGSRDLSLVSGEIALEAPGAFTVLDGVDRPSLTSVEPDRVRQSESTTITVCASSAFAAAPTLDLGEGLIVGESTLNKAGDCATAELVIDPDAPLGEREISTDDGVRILDGATLTVRDQAAPTSGNCGHAGGGLWWLGLLVVGRRFRD